MRRLGWTAALALTAAVPVFGAGPLAPLPPPAVETIDVSLVLVPVVVRDAAGRPILDLDRADFTITEEGSPQAIAAFGREARPVSIVLSLDTSPSMQKQDLAAKRAAIDFVRGPRADVAFAVESFDDAPRFDLGFTSDRGAVESTIANLRLAGDNTALFDAVDAATEKLASRDGGRVAVVFTDGTETLHPQDQSEKRLAAAIDASTRRDVSIYTVAFGPRAAFSVLKRMAEETGGEAFSALRTGDLPAAFASVAESVGSRYLLGYTPPAGAAGFRRIGVSVSRPGLKVSARRGYFTK